MTPSPRPGPQHPDLAHGKVELPQDAAEQGGLATPTGAQQAIAAAQAMGANQLAQCIAADGALTSTRKGRPYPDPSGLDGSHSLSQPPSP